MMMLVSAILTDLRQRIQGTYRDFRTNPVSLATRVNLLTIADAITRRFTFMGTLDPEATMDAEDILDLDFNCATGNLALFLRRYRHARASNSELRSLVRDYFGGYGHYDRTEVTVRPIRRAGRNPEHCDASFENAVRFDEDGRES
jgi:hypothetical protein